MRLDQVYDLVERNIGSEVRAKIAAISKEVPHPLAQAVAKVICLLQYVKSVHRTAENIAAALHPSIDTDSQLAAVKEALRALEVAHKVRLGDDGYRIPTPAEDDWERSRTASAPSPATRTGFTPRSSPRFWQPQPTHTLFETQTFKAGLAINSREVVDGDMTFHLQLAAEGKEFDALAAELRSRSQQERKSVFWAVALGDSIDRATIEVFRSKEMLSRKEREAKPGDEAALIGEEKLRLRRHQTSSGGSSASHASPAQSISAATIAAPTIGPRMSARPRGRGARAGTARGLRSLQGGRRRRQPT